MKSIKLLLALSAITTVANAQSWITNGLVGYYPFNGNAADLSGNGNNGTLYGVTTTIDRFGKSASAIHFSGQSYVDLGKNLYPALQANYTESCWIKSTQALEPISGGYNKHIVFMTRRTGVSDSGAGGWATLGINNQQKFSLVVDDQFYWNNNCSTSTNVLDGQWHCVLGTKAGTTYSLYLDGVIVSSVTDSHVMRPTSGVSGFWLGKHFWHNFAPLETAYYQGDMDDVRLYNRALSASEVGQLYAYESGPTANFIKAVKPEFSNLILGANYQMQLSGNMNTWTNFGLPFSATNSSMVYPQYWDVPNWGQLYLRVQPVP